MKPYPKYKPSGIEWIGEIPSHWQMKKIAHGFERIGSGTTPSSGKSEYYQDGTINWLQTGDLTDGEVLRTSKKVTPQALKDFSALKYFQAESIVMAMYGATIGKMGILKIETTTNQACCVMAEPKSFTPKYAFYWLAASRKHIISLSYGGGQPNISQAIISTIRMHCPPMAEQTAIAEYLDKKTAQIDELIEGKQKLIEFLKEERTAIINHAVTKGIDTSVKLKPSNIEWFGDIPEKWRIKKLGYLAEITKLTGFEYTNKWNSSEDGEIIALRGYNIGEGYLDISRVEKISTNLSNELVRSKLFKGDIVYPCTGTIGNAALIEKDNKYHINQNIAKITPNHLINPEFLLWALLSAGVKSQIHYNNASQMQPVILIGDLRQMKICVPSDLEEQLAILERIKSETKRMDEVISTIEKEIELMQEYRTALISEVVTGKVKVG